MSSRALRAMLRNDGLKRRGGRELRRPPDARRWAALRAMVEPACGARITWLHHDYLQGRAAVVVGSVASVGARGSSRSTRPDQL